MSPKGEVLTVTSLTKRFGKVSAVQDLSFTVQPGRVTGFLGPNGSGKTTTLRCLLGLVQPTSGKAQVGGHDYRELPHPAAIVGAALEASGFHPGRTARGHLRVITDAAALPAARADEVLALVGLTEAAGRKVGGFSLGMRQRLALAAALVGDPGVLILDEPANGLDPEGIAWLRNFLRARAEEGRTVLVSSHVLSEVQQTVDDVVIISKGRLVQTGSLDELTSAGLTQVRVRTPNLDVLRAALVAETGTTGVHICDVSPDEILVSGLSAPEIGNLALHKQVELHELTPVGTDLEALFLELTAGGNPGGAA